jgi:bifunctional non-homologous end joining protein LigD
VAYEASGEAARYDRACIPTRASKPPVGTQWIHEIKQDGYRLIARKREGERAPIHAPTFEDALSDLGTAKAIINSKANDVVDHVGACRNRRKRSNARK